MILHIIARDDWAHTLWAGSYHPASLDNEGFIHFSTPEQVVGTANLFYRSAADLVLLVVDPTKLSAEVRYEAPAEAHDSSALFPHLYGELNLDAVIRVVDFPQEAEGGWSALPAGATDS